jgi:Trk K+ transport system NAD-binding subunit
VGAIARGEEVILPEAETAFTPGDRVTILGKKAAIAKAAELLGGTGSEFAS